MGEKKRWLNLLVIPLVLIILGIALFMYGFELVSIPHAKEYAEAVYVGLGIIIFLAGIGWLAYQFKGPKE